VKTDLNYTSTQSNETEKLQLSENDLTDLQEKIEEVRNDLKKVGDIDADDVVVHDIDIDSLNRRLDEVKGNMHSTSEDPEPEEKKEIKDHSDSIEEL